MEQFGIKFKTDKHNVIKWKNISQGYSRSEGDLSQTKQWRCIISQTVNYLTRSLLL